MDANNTPADVSNAAGESSTSFSPRYLWQVPLFFLGVVALVTAFLARGYVAPDPVRQLHHDLGEARRMLNHQAGDPEAALALAQRAVENVSYDPERAAEAFFLLGSAQIRVAEQSGDAADEPWQQAKQSLQEAERRGLSGEDLGRLNYRMAKIAFHNHEDPRKVINLLKSNSEQADDRAEALTLLSQAYLRLTPPGFREALEANKKLREEVPQIGEDVLGPAKLAGAKLLLQMGQREEARKTLEKINEQSPAAVRAEKLVLLSGLYQEEHKWPQAAELWRTVLADKRVAPNEIGSALYNLGVCYRQLDQNKQASEAWTDCLRRGTGEEIAASALALAELHLRESSPDKAVARLAEAVAKIRKADDWKNTLMDLPRVRDLFEQAMTTCRQAQRFDLAVQTAELYERVAAPPRAQVRRAELNSEWAAIVQDRLRTAKDPAARKKEETTADALLRQAADAHAEAAKLQSKKDERDKHLWQSAVCSFEGHDYRRAADKLGKIVETQTDNVDRQSEGWYLLGETCRNLNDAQAAKQAYKRCVDCSARFTCRARYQLATIEIDAGRIDAATRELEQNLLMDHRDPDLEAHEKSLFALCSLLYQSASSLPQNYRRVVQHLEGPLDHFSATPEAVRARFQLADSYRQIVAQSTINHYMNEKMSEDAQKHYLDLSQKNWARAAEEFAKLEELLDKPELASLLSVNQQIEVPFHVAECYYNLGDYAKALTKFEALAQRWGNRKEGLRALGESIRCLGSMEDYDRLAKRAEQIQNMLPTTEGVSKDDQQVWLEWLNQAKQDPRKKPERQTGRDQPIILNGLGNPLGKQ